MKWSHAVLVIFLVGYCCSCNIRVALACGSNLFTRYWLDLSYTIPNFAIHAHRLREYLQSSSIFCIMYPIWIVMKIVNYNDSEFLLYRQQSRRHRKTFLAKITLQFEWLRGKNFRTLPSRLGIYLHHLPMIWTRRYRSICEWHKCSNTKSQYTRLCGRYMAPSDDFDWLLGTLHSYASEFTEYTSPLLSEAYFIMWWWRI